MPVDRGTIQPGAVFSFKNGPRRVVEVTVSYVRWEYADGLKRGGRLGGRQKRHYFAYDAKALISDCGTGG